MSEPVIKPRGYQCPTCRHMAYENMRGGPWMHCSLCDVDTEPLYGPDALVRAVAEVFQACNVVGLNGEAVTPNELVDRLTKGDV